MDKDDPEWNEAPYDPFGDEVWGPTREEEDRDQRREARRERMEERAEAWMYGRQYNGEPEYDTEEEQDSADSGEHRGRGNAFAPPQIHPEVLDAVQKARAALPTLAGRLEGIALGIASSLDHFTAFIKLLDKTKVKTLSLGLSHSAAVRQDWSSTTTAYSRKRFSTALNKLVGLEDLTMVIAEDLDE